MGTMDHVEANVARPRVRARFEEDRGSIIQYFMVDPTRSYFDKEKYIVLLLVVKGFCRNLKTSYRRTYETPVTAGVRAGRLAPR